ncbi:TrmB family transcriptional regulator [Halobaculum magnesiiphilum]|uniref:TrmB family transcriptional regulator n=1 Tax=Halobaculum magnesiiphilum TaxID=1017351 RepID=A0A8T8WII6_9EURY|nr:TrmB family transcriptional regulator sugar-binding domain-containing protein [Halobaculum magnesiiphilum]QZP39648.1 TrmB family transcriptional regulator [Halobaculum magnesiiphilum]
MTTGPGDPPDAAAAGDVDVEELLKRFGLSDKEVDTYLTLLEHGEAKASTVAEAAGVSKRYVYSASEELAARGFVTVNDHVTPTTIRANPPGEVVDRLANDAQSMRPALEARFSRAEAATEPFEVVKSRVTVVKRIRRAIEDATEEVTLSFPLDRLDEVADELRDAVDRGVLVLLLLTGVDEPVAGFEERYAGVASAARTWGQPMPSMLTVDGRTGVVAPAEMVARTNSGTQAIVFSQQQLGPVIVGSFIGNYWPAASEALLADPAPLPATYENFRHAVLQAELHRRSADAVAAHVSGRRTDTGESVEVTGEVVEVRQGLVEPANNEFPVQHTLTLALDDEQVTVGGKGAFVEDIEADEVELTTPTA